MARAESFASCFKLTESARAGVLARHNAYGDEYGTLLEGLSGEFRAQDLSHPLTERAAVEYLNQSALVEATSCKPEERSGESAVRGELVAGAGDELTELVATVDPLLVTLLAGELSSFDGRGPDYVRHFTTSYRELFGHLLWSLAPDEGVRG